MLNDTCPRLFRSLTAIFLIAALASPARADVITDWNTKANQIIIDSRMGTPPAVRLMAMVQTSVHDAVAEIARQPAGPRPSIEAAVAAANRTILVRALPGQQTAIHAAYQASMDGIGDNEARDAGIAVGERAAATVLAARAGDGAAASEAYRPHTTAGIYVPTVVPAVPQWAARKPWLMDSADRLRPGPPPATGSELWARDFNEVKALGARNSRLRNAEQTEIARFWEFSLPEVYHGLVRSVADAAGRNALANARLFAVVSQAMDDALISVMDAKYHYNFWRPVTAIRNADLDGNAGTESDATWVPFIDTPLHPEYPCAHCILASTVGTVLKAEIPAAKDLALSTTSPTAKGATRRWNSPEAMMREVADARIYDGVHYRYSTEVGLDMGRRLGELAASRLRTAAH